MQEYCPSCFSEFINQEGQGIGRWTDDPILTPNGLSGEDYKGFTPVRAVHVQELQTRYNILENAADLSQTSFSSINEKQKIKALHIEQLRISIENILNVVGFALSDYFKYDRYGNLTGLTKTEWTDVNRINKEDLPQDHPYGNILGDTVPLLTDPIKIKAIHIEELRIGMQVCFPLSSNSWSFRPDETVYGSNPLQANVSHTRQSSDDWNYNENTASLHGVLGGYVATIGRAGIIQYDYSGLLSDLSASSIATRNITRNDNSISYNALSSHNVAGTSFLVGSADGNVFNSFKSYATFKRRILLTEGSHTITIPVSGSSSFSSSVQNTFYQAGANVTAYVSIDGIHGEPGQEGYWTEVLYLHSQSHLNYRQHDGEYYDETDDETTVPIHNFSASFDVPGTGCYQVEIRIDFSLAETIQIAAQAVPITFPVPIPLPRNANSSASMNITVGNITIT